MITSITLKRNEIPKKLAELIHSNQFLKLFGFGSLVVLVLSFIAIIMMATKAPEIIVLDVKGNQIETQDIPSVKSFIEKAIREYIKYRYDWTHKDVKRKLESAEVFITKSNRNGFNNSIQKVINFSTSKKASQLAYPRKIEIDLKKQVAKVEGDRITSILGARAAGSLKLELHFKNGPHTPRNPWGVYIAKEVELL